MIFFIIPKTTGWFFKTMGFISQNDAYNFWGVSHPSFFRSGVWVRSGSFWDGVLFVLSRCFCSGLWAGAFVRFASVFRSLLLLFRLFFHFFVIELYFFLDFVWWFWSCAYFCGVGVITTETSPRRWETSVDRNVGCCNFMEFVVYIIPKTTGFVFLKRWVSFRKTTRIFFEGFHTPLFFAPGSGFAPGSES